MSKDNNLYYAWTDTFLITVYDEIGNYLRSLYIPFLQKSSTEMKSSPNTETGVKNKYLNQSRVRVLQSVELPGTWPALNSMLIDDENRIWVSTIIEDESWEIFFNRGILIEG